MSGSMFTSDAGTCKSGAQSLQDVQVVVTRPESQATGLLQELQQHGAIPYILPLIEIKPNLRTELLDQVRHLAEYDALIVSSANGIRALLEIYRWGGIDWPVNSPLCYSIGRATERIAETFGLRTVTFANVKTSADFTEALKVEFARTKPARILYIHGEQSERKISSLLTEAGFAVDGCALYETVDTVVDLATVAAGLNADKPIVYTFFSPSAVNAFLRRWPSFSAERTAQTYVVTIGNTTTMACDCHSVQVNGAAIQPSDTCLVDAVIRLFHK